MYSKWKQCEVGEISTFVSGYFQWNNKYIKIKILSLWISCHSLINSHNMKTCLFTHVFTWKTLLTTCSLPKQTMPRWYNVVSTHQELLFCRGERHMQLLTQGDNGIFELRFFQCPCFDVLTWLWASLSIPAHRVCILVLSATIHFYYTWALSMWW